MQHAIHYAENPLHGSIILPGSKAITYRAILLAALADGVSEITSMCVDNDIHTLINALYQLGIVSQLDESTQSCIIAGCNGRFPKKQATLWCNDNITTARLLLAAVASTPGVYYFDGSPQIRKTSIVNLLSVLGRQGVQLIPNDVTMLPFTLIGADTLEGGDIIFDSVVSAQTISALLIIAPYARSSFSFTLSYLKYQPNIDMTCTMMAEFGVLVHRIHHAQFMVPVPQRYQSRDYQIEPDFKLAGYLLAAAAVTSGEITIPGLPKTQSKQAAFKFLTILERMGCYISATDNKLTLKGPIELKGIEVDFREISDAFLIVMALAPFAKTPTRITYIKSLDKKGLKRIRIMKEALNKIGITVNTIEDGIEIYPGQTKNTLLKTHRDPKIAMTFFILGLKIHDLRIDNINIINAHYPEFLKIWQQFIKHKVAG